MISRTRTGRRHIGPGALAVLIAVLLLAVSACSTPAPQPSGQAGSISRPNIVFVLTDDLSMDLLPFMPHVAALEHEGTTFSHYYVVDSLCCPSRSAIFTGQYPHDDGVYRNEVTKAGDGGYTAFQAHGDENRTFALSLQRAGYRTAMMGKYLNGYEADDPIPPGWDEWDVGGNAYAEYDYMLNQDGIPVWYGGHTSATYLTNVLSQRAGQFIDESSHSRKPFALEIATFAPHRPANPAPRYAGTFAGVRPVHGPAWNTTPTGALPWLSHFPPLTPHNIKTIDHVYRKRIESVQSVDDMIAHLEKRLRADHELRKTYFVFSSDNGFHEGQYRLLPGKQTAFDTDIHVPLVVTGPGVPADRTVGSLASSIDLAPTFEQIGHARPADDPDGVSLLSLMHGQAAPADWQKAVLVEHHGPNLDRADPDYQSFRAGDPPSYEAIRTANALYVQYQDGAQEYYDLATDPDELDNLASTEPASVLGPMQRTVSELEHCHGHVQCQAAAAHP